MPTRKPITKTRRAYREGSITQRPNGLWVGRIEAGEDKDGKRRQVTVTAMDHRAFMEKFEKAKSEVKVFGYTADPTATLTQWSEKWLTQIASRNVRGKTYANYASHMRKWIQPKIGRRKLAKLTPDDWRAVRDWMLEEGCSTTHALGCYRTLSKCLNDALLEGVVTTNMLKRIKPPTKEANQRGSFSRDEFRRVLNAANVRHQAALLTAARQSELLGLTWPFVNLDGPYPEIVIEWQLQELRHKHGCGERGPDGRYPCGYKQSARCPKRGWQIPEGHEFILIEEPRLALVRPKSSQGERHIPLIPPLVAALRRHRDATPPGPHGLVWHNAGHPIHHKDDEAEWKDLMGRVGMSKERTLHWARHSAATLLMESGVDAKVVGEIAGHGSVAVTRGYQHVSSELARQGMSKLGELLG